MGAQIFADEDPLAVACDEVRRQGTPDSVQELKGRTLVVQACHSRTGGIIPENPRDDRVWHRGAARRFQRAAGHLRVVWEPFDARDADARPKPRGKQGFCRLHSRRRQSCIRGHFRVVIRRVNQTTAGSELRNERIRAHHLEIANAVARLICTAARFLKSASRGEVIRARRSHNISVALCVESNVIGSVGRGSTKVRGEHHTVSGGIDLHYKGITAATGYRDLAYLDRVFRAAEGISPQAYRKAKLSALQI